MTENESEKLPREGLEMRQGQLKAPKKISFLTLGDGDFTYSLDLARYLASTNTDTEYVVTASGVDTREELMSKYKDAPFVLKQLSNATVSVSSSVTHDKLTVHIRHGINAIAMPTIFVEGGEEGHDDHDDKRADKPTSNGIITPKSPGSQSPSSFEAKSSSDIQPADHVMFHHPHLATEDAVLHQKFLCHLFHTVNHVWLAPLVIESDTASDDNRLEDGTTGFFHLTLVKGQAERWKCLETARDQGFELVWRGPFVPPPPPLYPLQPGNGENLLTTTTYQLRRHQTGKSFASRRPEWQSESMIFQRKQASRETGSTQNTPILPWDISKKQKEEQQHQSNMIESSEVLENAKAKTGHHEGSLLACPHCEKVFREERSLKCHLKAKHASLIPQEENDHGGKRKKKTKRKREIASTITGGTINPLPCPHQCKGMDGELRTFCSQEALQSHIVAKHAGLHQKISPDWKQSRSEGGTTLDPPKDPGHTEDTSSTTTNNTPTPARKDLPKEIYGQCRICGWHFETKDSVLQHIHDFTPPSTVLSFSCRFCTKVFREKRARLQHENFCSHRNKAATTTIE